MDRRVGSAIQTTPDYQSHVDSAPDIRATLPPVSSNDNREPTTRSSSLFVFGSFLLLVGAAWFLLLALPGDQKAQGAAITIVAGAATHLAKEAAMLLRK